MLILPLIFPHFRFFLGVKFGHLGGPHNLLGTHEFRHFVGGTVLHYLFQLLMSSIFTTYFHGYAFGITLITVMIIYFVLIPNVFIRLNFFVTKRTLI